MASGKSTAQYDGPIRQAWAVTPSDTDHLTVGGKKAVARAINVATAGNVKVTTPAGNDVTVYVAAGIWFPIECTKIWSSGLTAVTVVAGN